MLFDRSSFERVVDALPFVALAHLELWSVINPLQLLMAAAESCKTFMLSASALA